MTGVVKVTSPRTLVIDIGGSKLKALTLNKSGEPISERQRLPTPDKPTNPPQNCFWQHLVN